jgi:hypothetical protein
MKLCGLTTLFLLQASAYVVSGFVTPSQRSHIAQFALSRRETTRSDAASFRFPTNSPLQVASAPLTTGDTPVSATIEGKKTIKELRKEGGILTFNTPIGALNPFAIYYGLMSIFLGIPWYIAMKFTQLLYWISRGKFDKKVRH